MCRKKVCVVVLGDIGRSPRMQYHAISLSEEKHIVDIVGYYGTTPTTSLTAQPLVSFHYLNPYPNIPLPRFLNYILKTLWQAISLLFVLMIIRKPDVLIVQNPPAVPTLLVCYFYTLIFGSKLLIDWHNYAHSIMALTVGPRNVLVRLTRQIETFVGRRADYNFCVTKEMKSDLQNRWNVNAAVLYDRPPEMFRPISLKEKHEVLSSLGKKYKELLSSTDSGTIFTRVKDDGSVELREDRPGLIMSSTSWTEDEDFSVLLSALQDYENICVNINEKRLPKLYCVITGKGPLKEFYSAKIKEAKWKHITVLTPWLEAKDYPLLVASADLGVSLHTSSSGLDLPMKVVDMFGCGLPVCAFNFKSLHELVEHEENGYTFNNTEELSAQIQEWFENFPNNLKQQEKVSNIKSKLKEFQSLRWHENWKFVVAPVLK